MTEKKYDIEQMHLIVAQMREAMKEHPKARVYFSPEQNEVRIIYPLPADLDGFRGGIIRNIGRSNEL